ncbi:MAG: cation diffusion facilitator family transporter, partial [Ignavibacteriaceae bacterium]
GAYLLTGSAAIFSDAAESVVHILATSMALYSIILSSKPADDSHPYGHGNVEYFSAAVEGLLIIAAALFIIYKSVLDIITVPVLKQLDLGVLIVAAAGGVNLILGMYLVRTGKKTNSLTLTADGKHVLTDSYTSIGVIIGVLLVMITGYKIFDPLFAIGVAVNILFTGYKLIRESVGGLMNENDPVLMEKICNKLIAIRKDYWIDIHELRFWKSGTTIFIDLHMIFPAYYTLEQSHKEERRIRQSLKEVLPDSNVKIHFDYCVQSLCEYCNYGDCKFRSLPATKAVNWNVDKLTGKPVYMLSQPPAKKQD